jgi:hypothetical protein
MTKIPVKIVEYTISGETRKNVMIDLMDTYDIDGDAEEKIKNFKKRYFEIVQKVKEILPKEKSERKPSHFWKIGKILNDFDKSIENSFEITNYQDAIQRDFNLYRKRMIGLILQFGKEFTKKDISDSISFSHYIELIWHANMLIKLKLFEQEKKRLLEMAKNKMLPNSHAYSKQLDKLTKPLHTRKIKND